MVKILFRTTHPRAVNGEIVWEKDVPFSVEVPKSLVSQLRNFYRR